MAPDPRFDRLRGITSRINLVGTDDEIKTQLSLLLGINELLDVTGKGLDLNFERWIDDFENGFKAFAPRLNKALNLNPWGQKQGERPRVRILTENKAYWSKEGYFLIEFLPNRDVLDESYLLFGTPIQLMQQLIERMNRKLEPKGEEMYAMPTSYFYETVTTVPQVILRFRESRIDALKNKRYKNPLKAIHYVRIKESFSTETEVNALKKKIETIFTNPTFDFNKGRTKYTYLGNQPRPLHIVAASSEAQAKALIRNLLAITNEKPKWTTLTESNSFQNFDVKESFKVKGQKYFRSTRRPLGKVWFISAELHVDGLTFNIPLINLSQGVNAGKWPK